MKALNKKRLKKGYSLLEVIISLSIMGFAITVMFSFLILSLRVSILSLGRSFVREELSSITGLIARDIRNTDYIVNCGSRTVSNSCELIQNGISYLWTKCDPTGAVNAAGTRICKLRLDPNNQKTVFFISSATINVKNFDFQLGYSTGTSGAQTNILILINASHTNSAYNINNVVRQISVSTRNF